MGGVYRLPAREGDSVLGSGVVDFEEAEERFGPEIREAMIDGVFRRIDDVESSAVMVLVPFCCKRVNELVLRGMDGNGHDV